MKILNLIYFIIPNSKKKSGENLHNNHFPTKMSHSMKSVSIKFGFMTIIWESFRIYIENGNWVENC